MDKAKGRKSDRILQALLTSRTIAESAKVAKVSERVVYTYLSDPDFKARYDKACADVLRGITNQLREHMSKAIVTIVEIMTDPENTAKDRLNAAKTILEYNAKYSDMQEVNERLQRLEALINEIQE